MRHRFCSLDAHAGFPGQCVTGVGAVCEWSRGSVESGQCVNGVGAVWSRGSVWMESGQCGVGAVCEWSRGSVESGQCVNGVGAVLTGRPWLRPPECSARDSARSAFCRAAWLDSGTSVSLALTGNRSTLGAIMYSVQSQHNSKTNEQ